MTCLRLDTFIAPYIMLIPSSITTSLGFFKNTNCSIFYEKQLNKFKQKIYKKLLKSRCFWIVATRALINGLKLRLIFHYRSCRQSRHKVGLPWPSNSKCNFKNGTFSFRRPHVSGHHCQLHLLSWRHQCLQGEFDRFAAGLLDPHLICLLLVT